MTYISSLGSFRPSQYAAPKPGSDIIPLAQTTENKLTGAAPVNKAVGGLMRPSSARTSLQTQVTTQILASKEQNPVKAPTQEFLDFAALSWEQKIRYQILKSMNLDEKTLAALPPAEREKIEEKIKAIIKAEIERKAKEIPS